MLATTASRQDCLIEHMATASRRAAGMWGRGGSLRSSISLFALVALPSGDRDAALLSAEPIATLRGAGAGAGTKRRQAAGCAERPITCSGGRQQPQLREAAHLYYWRMPFRR